MTTQRPRLELLRGATLNAVKDPAAKPDIDKTRALLLALEILHCKDLILGRALETSRDEALDAPANLNTKIDELLLMEPELVEKEINPIVFQIITIVKPLTLNPPPGRRSTTFANALGNLSYNPKKYAPQDLELGQG
jgi:hypothetical protein